MAQSEFAHITDEKSVHAPSGTVRFSVPGESAAPEPESPARAAERAQGDYLVDRLIDMGIDVRMDRERMKSILASGEYHSLSDASRPKALPSRGFDTPSGRCRMLWYSNWDVYGLVQGDTIYLDPDKIKAETPIHEYTHLMTEVVRRKSPALWSRIVSTLRSNPVWDELRGNAAYASIHGNEDEMADEVLATVSGRRGAELLAQLREDYLSSHPSASAREAAEAAASGASDAVSRFWNGTADLFGYEHSRSAEDLADTALAYLLAGVNPKTMLSVEKSREASRNASRRSDPITEGFASAGFPVKDPDDPGRDLSYFREGETQDYLEGMGLFLDCGVARSTGWYLFGRLAPPAEIVGFEQDASGKIILRYHEMGDRKRTLRTIPLEDARLTEKDKMSIENWLFHSIRPAGSRQSHDGREAGAVQYALAKRMADGLDSGMPTGVVLERTPDGLLKAVPVGVRRGPRGDEVHPLSDAEMREFVSRATAVGEGPAWRAFMPAAEGLRKHALSSPLALARTRIEQGLTREFDRLFPGVSKVFFDVERVDRWGMATTEKMGFGAMMLFLAGDRSAGLQAELSHCAPVAERLLNALCRRESEGPMVLTAADGSTVKIPSPPQQLVASLTLRAVQAALEGKRAEVSRQLDDATLKGDETEIEKGTRREAELACAAEAAAEFFRTHSAPYDAPTKESVRSFILTELLAEPGVSPREAPWGDDGNEPMEPLEEKPAPSLKTDMFGLELAALLRNAAESLAKDSGKALSLRVDGPLALSDGNLREKAVKPSREKGEYNGTKNGYGKKGYGKSYQNGTNSKKNKARATYAKFAEAADESKSHKI